MKRIFRTFLIAWACVFLVSFFTASNSISFVQRILFSGALALVVPALSFGKAHSKKQSTAKSNHTFPQDVDIHLPLDPKVLYRVRNGKIYRGMDAAPIYEIRDNNIYPALSPKLAYRIENSKVYRGWDAAPILEIKNCKIYQVLSSKVEYEIWTPEGL